MSELTNMQGSHRGFRRNLLTNVSILALLGYLGAPTGTLAASAEEDFPTIWIELGGQLERVDGEQTIFSPPFLTQGPSTDRGLMVTAQGVPRYSIGGEGKILFVPEATDWVFSAAIRYGRSNGGQHLHHQTPGIYSQTKVYVGRSTAFFKPQKEKFGDAQTKSDESHFVLDFQAGKDVGLGLFGDGGRSVISAGVRYAQFTSSVDTTLHARPVQSLEFVTVPGEYRWFNNAHHTYTAIFHAERNTHAVGPSISWDASAPLAGRNPDMTVAFDWGVNAALLFGRQRAQVHHQTTGYSFQHTGGYFHAVYHTNHYAHTTDHVRARSLTIPNVGGFAGVSFLYLDAKLSFGYRADFFFGAIDNGIDTAKKENIGFYGPFASVSIGLGG